MIPHTSTGVAELLGRLPYPNPTAEVVDVAPESSVCMGLCYTPTPSVDPMLQGSVTSTASTCSLDFVRSSPLPHPGVLKQL